MHLNETYYLVFQINLTIGDFCTQREHSHPWLVSLNLEKKLALCCFMLGKKLNRMLLDFFHSNGKQTGQLFTSKLLIKKEKQKYWWTVFIWNVALQDLLNKITVSILSFWKEKKTWLILWWMLRGLDLKVGTELKD